MGDVCGVVAGRRRLLVPVLGALKQLIFINGCDDGHLSFPN
jgi:hypothetical protein